LLTVCVVEVLTFVFDRLDEVHTLQEAVDRFTVEKREIEKQLAAQEENCRQLTQANNTLSARALTLADEAATAPEKVRKELMAQLTECRANLKEAQEELDAVRRSDQSQTEALLDELNSLQTDNGNLRAQLRAVKK
jgi:chromosome segregation ATPase